MGARARVQYFRPRESSHKLQKKYFPMTKQPNWEPKNKANIETDAKHRPNSKKLNGKSSFVRKNKWKVCRRCVFSYILDSGLHFVCVNWYGPVFRVTQQQNAARAEVAFYSSHGRLHSTRMLCDTGYEPKYGDRGEKCKRLEVFNCANVVSLLRNKRVMLTRLPGRMEIGCCANRIRRDGHSDGRRYCNNNDEALFQIRGL